MDTQNLTILETYLLKSSFEHFNITQITTAEGAVFETEATQVQARKIALGKLTRLILPLFKRLRSKVFILKALVGMIRHRRMTSLKKGYGRGNFE